MNGYFVFGQYYHSDSWLHRLDPRTKIMAIFLVLASLFLLGEILSLAIALALVLLLILSSKIPITKFLASLRTMSVIIFFTVFFQVLFNRGSTAIYTFNFTLTWLNLALGIALFVLYFYLGRFFKKFRFLQFLALFFLVFYVQVLITSPLVITSYTITVYKDSLTTSLIVVLRILSLIFMSSLLTLTTKPTDLNRGLELLLKPLKYIGVKVSVFSMMISITLRFIPTLFLEAQKILKAQASRGVDFKEGRLQQKVTQIISLLLPMFIISLRKAYDLADTMEVRGYVPGAERTSINLLRFRAIDIVVLVFVVGMLAGLITLNVMKYAI